MTQTEEASWNYFVNAVQSSKNVPVMLFTVINALS